MNSPRLLSLGVAVLGGLTVLGGLPTSAYATARGGPPKKRPVPKNRPDRAQTKHPQLAREAAIETVKRLWDQGPADRPFSDIVASTAKAWPDFNLALLAELLPHDAVLRERVRRSIEIEAKRGDETSVAVPLLTSTQMERLHFPVTFLTRILGRSNSDVRARLLSELQAVAKRTGDGKRLSPRRLDKNSRPAPLVEALVEEIYRMKSRQAWSLKEIEAALPQAAARVLSRRPGDPALAQWTTSLLVETLGDLSWRYERDVTLGQMPPYVFFKRQSLGRLGPSLMRDYPTLFPALDAIPLSNAYLSHLADLCRRWLEKKVSQVYLFRRVSPDLLRILQQVDSRFSKGWNSARWGSDVIDAQDLDQLEDMWRQHVLQSHRVTEAQFDALVYQLVGRKGHVVRDNYPERFRRFASPRKFTRERAHLLGSKAKELLQADPLLKKANVLEKLRQVDPGVDGRLYGHLQERFSDEFPRIGDVSTILSALAAEIRELRTKRRDITLSDIVREMKRRHPNFKRSRIYQLREYDPELLPREETAASATVRVQRPAGVPYREQHDEVDRVAFRMAKLLELAIRLAPPWKTRDQILLALRHMIDLPVPNSIDVAFHWLDRYRLGNAFKIQNRLVSEMVAEYTLAAPKGAGPDQILRRIADEHPALNVRKLKRYLQEWAQEPDRVPAFAALGLPGRLEGQGQRIERPRFMGGWDARRRVAHATADEQHELARGSQFADIVERLPMLDALVEKHAGGRPFSNQNMLVVSHLFGTNVALLNALARAGASTPRTLIVGTPYGSNPAVVETLRARGYNVTVPKLSVEAHRAAVESAIRKSIERYEENGQPIIALDDGGMVAEILHEDPKCRPYLHAFKIVEQTTRGLDVAERFNLGVKVVNVAGSNSKQAEAPLIGQSVVAKLGQFLARRGHVSIKDWPVVVLGGGGTIGLPTAEELRKAGAQVTIIEPAADRAIEAARLGFRVLRGMETLGERAGEREDALRRAKLVIGVSGQQSISVDDLKVLSDEAFVVQASSKQVEIDMRGLHAAADRRVEVPAGSPLVTLPTARYRIGRKWITLLGDGWPINFDGDVDTIPPQAIQLTRAVMFAGALQAARMPVRSVQNGVLPLEDWRDAEVLDLYRKHGPKGPLTFTNPDEWQEWVVKLAEALQ